MIDELLDLVDGNDRVIGQQKRSEIYRLGLTNFRVVNAFLVNQEDKLWIPRRSSEKSIFPLCLDISMGGHVLAGENYEEAFRRELREELDLGLDDIPWRLIGHLTPQKHGVSAFMKVYQIDNDRTPTYNEDDFVEFFWLTPQEVLKRIDSGDRAKDDLPKLIKWFMAR